ncbi:MAG: RimK family alpha-L-glutamate ligase [Nitriliruptorales bacterium]
MTIWVLTDRRYMRQRMPLSLLDELDRCAIHSAPVVADDIVADLIGGVDLWLGLRPGDTVVARTRHGLGLQLLREAEARGARLLMPWDGVMAVRDKPRALADLARRGVPVPPTYVAARPAELAELPRSAFPLVLKPPFGDNARGILLARTPDELHEATWDGDLVLAQPYLEVGGVDYKLYVAGDHVWMVRRPSPLLAVVAEAPRPTRAVPPPPRLRSLALTCRDAFRLPLLGVDVLMGASGPVVVDVNDFPNYTGVDSAPGAIVDVLRAWPGLAA